MANLFLATLAVVGAFLLAGCAPSDKPSDFDTWYEEVINEPYNPTGLNDDN